MKKALIVTPNWPPISCPDMHRVRMSLPFWEQFGWKPLILKIDPEQQEGLKDFALLKTVPETVKTWQAGYISQYWTHWFGLRNIGLRSIAHLAILGDRIIQSQNPKIVFVSTTMFPLMVLAVYWKFKHGIPYVLDFQDPWLNDYTVNKNIPLYQTWKYKFSQFLAAHLEPLVIRHSSHVISVSSGYVEKFLRRYIWLKSEQFTVLPFGSAETDFNLLQRSPINQSYFDIKDGKEHWVYVGRGGHDMSFALRSLFFALKQQEEYFLKNIKLHFIGTDYAPRDRAKKTVEPIAQEYGLGDIVEEHPNRIPYFEALQCLLDAHALIVPGSDDPAYSASKIYPYILAKKPLLAIFHEQSIVLDVLRSTHSGKVVTFNSSDTPDNVAMEITNQWFNSDRLTQPNTDWQKFDPYTAKEMTRRLCNVFDKCFISS